jgi:hypothetical protein
MAEILKTMTIQEAAPLWDDLRRVHLQKWAETFVFPLEEFHYGHIVTYEKDRLAEAPYSVVWTEILALRALLKQVGLGDEIEARYMTPLDRVRLTPDELEALPARAQAYIKYLEALR